MALYATVPAMSVQAGVLHAGRTVILGKTTLLLSVPWRLTASEGGTNGNTTVH